MKSYPQLVFCVPKMINVSEIVYVENLDSSELVEERMPNKPENKDEENCTVDDYNLILTQKLRKILKLMSYKSYTMLQ